ncbi:MAG: hypothetical protein KAT79_04055, partial [candidate division Zixibacteria bacterium]|nr:hypothetical protein [candidate division Zixibacteria bacterium]
LPRFLEDWAGRDFDWTGTLIQMWHSQQANGTYKDAADINAYYTDPTRNWQHDADLSDPTLQPPSAPTIRLFLRTGWNQEYVEL